jgi:NAD+ kinase
MKVRSVGVFLKRDQPQALTALRGLLAWLAERRIEALVDEECARWCDLPATPTDELADRVDLIVVLGGDGTLLAVARALGTRSVPILGVNLGTLGYLTEVPAEELFPALEQVIAGRAEIQARMRLEVVAERDGRELGRYLALNEAVITNSRISRMVHLEAFADGLPVTRYRADGLIVATPTGSTAYSLSAGGPLLVPGSGVVVITPICPHTLSQRPLVLPQSAALELRVLDTRGGEVALTVDGQAGAELQDGDRVQIRRSEHPTSIVSSPLLNPFELLRTKLRWGQ